MTVLVFGPLREAVGAASIQIADAATAGEVKRRAAEAHPEAAELIARCAVAVDGAYVGPDEPADGEVALIPPVSGGAGTLPSCG